MRGSLSGVRHIGIYVSDLEAMKHFYMNCFGFKEKSSAMEGGDYLESLLSVPRISLENSKLIDQNGMILELLKTHAKYENNHSNSVCWLGCMHIAFTVSNAEVMRSRIIKMGGEPLSDCLISPDDRAKVFFCKDPEGNYLEVVEEI